MAIDFKNKTDNHNSSKNPFGNTSQTGSSQSTGFSFGGGKQDQKKQTNTDQNRGKGFSFDGQRDRTRSSGNGFSNLPVIRPDNSLTQRHRGSTYTRTRRDSGLADVDIPWKAIIYVCLVILVVGLLVYFWDVITYVFTNLIAMLLLVVLLLLLIRWLLRPRR